MSILKVDTINEKTTGNGVIIPGHAVHIERVISTADVTVTSSGTTYTDVWTVNYTPKLTTSSLFFQYNAILRSYKDGSHDSRFNLRVLHNGSNVYTTTDLGEYDYGGSGQWNKWQFSDATSYSNTNGSQITWKLQLARSGSTDVRFGEAATTSGTMIIMEVAP
jgi:hypothetical protein|tara:strand:+ start:770 stop:1258 length:489 start_codon:yes stop_codon:yes gene_type:complete